MTISKDEGQMLKRVLIYLPSLDLYFSCGQLYVTFSDKVAVAIIEVYRQTAENHRWIISNFVYREVL
jgi:hypothetical protein